MISYRQYPIKIQVIIHWFLVLFWAAVIFFLSAQPSLLLPTGIVGELLSKSAHFAEFFIFTFLLFNALKQHKKIKNPLLKAVLVALAYGAFDEFHQHFVMGRNSDIFDFLVDSTGVFTLGLILLLKQRL